MNKYWLISADMGYGHQRAIYPLRHIANEGKIFNANRMNNASHREIRQWAHLLAGYEFISRAIRLPVIGKIFALFLDNLLYIPKFYPLSARSATTYHVKYLKKRIKKGLTDSVIQQINNPDLPVITSFHTIAIAADMVKHRGIYCIICDTDINRAWVAEDPVNSRIIYFASGSISEQRLFAYGVREENIKLTGFPLPLELLGDRSLNILKANLIRRLRILDPEDKFYTLYKHSVNAFLDYDSSYILSPGLSSEPLTITYVVGGAGAQKETGEQIAVSLSKKINEGKIKLNLVAGTRSDIRDSYLRLKEKLTPGNQNFSIVWAEDTLRYFDIFNEILATTDILWTKPSELSFYCALGIPIIMTPPIGPQEKCNRRWLRETGAGIKQLNPQFTDQWLSDLHKKGRFAEYAWLGFLKARKYGTYNILDYMETGSFAVSNDPLKR